MVLNVHMNFFMTVQTEHSILLVLVNLHLSNEMLNHQ